MKVNYRRQKFEKCRFIKATKIKNISINFLLALPTWPTQIVSTGSPSRGGDVAVYVLT